MGHTITIAFIQCMSSDPNSKYLNSAFSKLLKRYFAIQFTYIQWVIIPMMIDFTINSSSL